MKVKSGYLECKKGMEPLPYYSPTLRNYGDIRDITMGGTPGGGDSGNPHVANPPAFSGGGGGGGTDGKRGARPRRK